MTLREKLYHDALMAIAERDCAGFCGLIAQKALQRARDEDVDQIVRRNEQAIEVFRKVFGK